MNTEAPMDADPIKELKEAIAKAGQKVAVCFCARPVALAIDKGGRCFIYISRHCGIEDEEIRAGEAMRLYAFGMVNSDDCEQGEGHTAFLNLIAKRLEGGALCALS